MRRAASSGGPGAAVYRHVPVLLEEAVRAWRGVPSTPAPAPLYFADATCGGGGHSALLLQREPRAQLFCLDRDPDAVEACRARLPPARARVESGGFAALRQAMRRADFPPAAGPSASVSASAKAPPMQLLHGILADLGASSHQLDVAERGFSFRADRDGPLDMRMERTRTPLAPVVAPGAPSRPPGGGADDLESLLLPSPSAPAPAPATSTSPAVAPAPFYEDDSDTTTAVTAADLVNQLPEAELARLLADYGEERQAHRVARALVLRRAQRPFLRTLDLAEAVAATLRPPSGSGPGGFGGFGGGGGGFGHPATKTFMALRIAVNGELRQLQRLLAHAPAMLAPGANLAVISFHSLEDRMVKRAFAELSAGGGMSASAAAAAAEVGRAPRVSAESARAPRAPRTAAQPPSALAPSAPAAPALFTASPECIVASEAELQRNPRARSAKLRVLTRL